MARYMDVLKKDSNVLHYQRRPKMGSVWSVLIVVVFTLLVSFTANHWAIAGVIWIVGMYISYLATEKYEECILDKEKDKVTFRSARIIEKRLLGFRKLIVMNVSSILDVRVFSEEGKRDKKKKKHQVEILFENGLTLSMTSCLTFDPISCHEEVIQEVKEFLGLLGRSSGPQQDLLASSGERLQGEQQQQQQQQDQDQDPDPVRTGGDEGSTCGTKKDN